MDNNKYRPSKFTINTQNFDNLDNIENPISPLNINDRILKFKRKYLSRKKIDHKIGNEKKRETNNEIYSQIYTDAIKDYNLNSFDFTRFQDFLLSSQNYNIQQSEATKINFLTNLSEETDYSNNNIHKNQNFTNIYKKKIIKSNYPNKI